MKNWIGLIVLVVMVAGCSAGTSDGSFRAAAGGGVGETLIALGEQVTQREGMRQTTAQFEAQLNAEKAADFQNTLRLLLGIGGVSGLAALFVWWRLSDAQIKATMPQPVQVLPAPQPAALLAEPAPRLALPVLPVGLHWDYIDGEWCVVDSVRMEIRPAALLEDRRQFKIVARGEHDYE